MEIAKEIPKSTLDLDEVRPQRRPPNQAFSDFVIHREQGDWAEFILLCGLRNTLGSEYGAIKYGKSDKIIAGQPGFKEFYDNYQHELSTIGKRPDILILPSEITDEEDISNSEQDVLSGYVKHAILGIESRSSAFLVNKYKQKTKDDKKKFLSFTPKIEDILVVLKWIKTYNVPHYYAQVFFDEVHIISFQKILEIIRDDPSDRTMYKITRHTRSQKKPTIHINISNGVKIGDIEAPPDHQSKRTELDSGRLLHYVKFDNGRIRMNKESLHSIIMESKRQK